MDESDRIASIRARAYAIVESDPGGPKAEEARKILASLPKTHVGPLSERMDSLRTKKPRAVEAFRGGDSGIEAPKTSDEEVGLTNRLATPSSLQQAAATYLSPSTRRQFERGMDRGTGFGIGNRVADAVSGGEWGKAEAEDAATSPMAGPIGEAIGSQLGLSRYLGKGLGSAMGGAFRPLTSSGVGGTAFAGLLGGAASNALMMPIMRGSQAAIGGRQEGEDVRDYATRVVSTVGDELKNPINPIVGAGFGLLTGLGAGIANSRTQTGRDIRLTESYGATPTPFGGARGGAFASPVMQDVEGSTREAGAFAKRMGRKVYNGLEEEDAALGRKFAADKAAAGDAGYFEGKVSGDEVVDVANKLIASERLTIPQQGQLRSEVIDVLKKYPNGVDVETMNNLRARWADLADFGDGGAAKHPALGDVFTAAKDAVDNTEMGPINRAYHEGKEALRTKRGQLQIKENTDQRVAEDRIAREILRRGENTPTSGVQEPDIEEFLAANPSYRPLFDSVALLNAKERMGLGLGHGGTLYTHLRGAAHHNIEPLTVGAYRLALPADRLAAPASLAAQYLLSGGGGSE